MFLIIKTIQRNVIHVQMSKRKVPAVFDIFYSNFNFFRNIFEPPPLSYVYELFLANRETEKQEDTRTDRWSNRHKGANNRFSKLSNTPKEAGILAQALRVCSTRP